MAVENRVILNGQIKKYTPFRNKETGETVRIDIVLMVMRRPNAPMGNKKGQVRMDDIPVMVRDEVQIRYLLENHASKGDLLEASGLLNTVHSEKQFFCKKCGEVNYYDGTLTYVTPLCLELTVAHPKQIETIALDADECETDDLKKLLEEKKTSKGRIINAEVVEEDEYGGATVRIVVQEETTDKEAREWMLHMSDISNEIHVIGNLCADPAYNVNASGGRTCTYQLGINRKVFVKEDDPSLRADYPFIKSINDQADKDKEALSQGSLVFIEGAIQSRDGFTVNRECSHCGEVNKVKGDTLEIVPYSVEYLRNCNTDALEDNDTEGAKDMPNEAPEEDEE